MHKMSVVVHVYRLLIYTPVLITCSSLQALSGPKSFIINFIYLQFLKIYSGLQTGMQH